MEHSFEELAKKKLAELRAIAEGLQHDALHGYTTMHKGPLLQALCTALGIEAHAHHAAMGIDKTALKGQIRELKTRRDAALAARDRTAVKRLRRKIRRLKRTTRRASV